MKKLILTLMIGGFLTIQTTMCQNTPCDSVKMNLKDHIDSVCLCSSSYSTEKVKSDKPILAIEVPAIFPNGDLSDFRDFIQDCVTDSFNDLTGKVFVRFVIDTDGSIVDPDILRCNNTHLARAALECLKKSPKWIPAKQKGRNVKQQFVIPIVGKK